MKEDRIWVLLAKKKSGEATSEDLAELEALIKQHEKFGFSGEVIDKIWDLPFNVLQEQGSGNKTNIWNKIEERLPTTKPIVIVSHLKILMIAASLLLLTAIGIITYLQLNKSNTHNQSASSQPSGSVNEVSTQRGSRTKIILPDGTKVWLNVSSKLTYANDFNHAPDREVTLSGEAFFEVAHRADRPFIIHTKDMNIQDIGTAFDVKAYPDEKTVEATLISGAIEITSQHDPKLKILLKPNERIIIPANIQNSKITGKMAGSIHEDLLYSITQVKKDQYGLMPQTAWVQNKLVFDDESFEELAPEMEKWYNIHIHFKDEKAKQIRFSGIIEKESIEQALNAMQLSYPFKYTMNGNDIWISEN